MSGIISDNLGRSSGLTKAVAAGRTGTVDWDTTPKTGTVTAATGKGYFVNTTSGAITVNLPAGAAGSIVSVADYAGTWQTNNVTVSPNGSEKMGGVAADITLSTEGQSVTLVYVDSTQGWLNTMDSTSNVRANAFLAATGGNSTATSGDYKIHTFTSPGTFCVSSIGGIVANNIVDYVVVAGGGGAGDPGDGGRSSGSGGAGGFRFYANTPVNPQGGPAAPINNFPSGTAITVSASPYSIAVGGGGASGSAPSTAGASGVNSTFSTITSNGGGSNSVAGGSGGGVYSAGGGSGCNGNTPPTSPAQGRPGGDAINDNSPSGGGNYVGAAGGGAITDGGNASTSSPYGAVGGAGAGIAGFGTSGENSGSYYYFSGGGGGGGQAIKGPAPGFRTAAVGGIGGGGDGQISASAGPAGQAGATNTGGGAGGGGCNSSCNSGTGAAGGSGIVIIRYKFQ
jgi:hypothetical protein